MAQCLFQYNCFEGIKTYLLLLIKSHFYHLKHPFFIMSKINTGYAKNVSQFKEIFKTLINMGAKWNPANKKLKMEALVARHTVCEKVLSELSLALALDKQKTAERLNVYEPLNDIVRRALAAAICCEVDDSAIERAQTLKNLIDGTNVSQASAKRAKEAKLRKAMVLTVGEDGVGNTDAVPLTPKNYSVSRMAYDTRLHNFKQFIVTLETAGKYETNEADLKLTALNALADALTVANDATNDAWNLANNKRDERNVLFFGVKNSMLHDIKLIKKQLESSESKDGPNYKKVADYTFIKPKEN